MQDTGLMWINPADQSAGNLLAATFVGSSVVR
jgi:hypothetical protein